MLCQTEYDTVTAESEGSAMHILVTGAAGGMGKAICRRLRDEGCTVYGVDRKTENGIFPCDVTSEASVSDAFAKIRAVTDHLDAIVHTAGIYDLDSLLEMDEARFSRILEVNLAGVYRVNKAFLPLLRAGSRILITTSELAPLDPLPFTGVYAMTKAALEKYAFSLRMELRLLDISVSVLRPGAVQTDLLGDSTAALDRFYAKTQLYRCNATRFKHIVDSVEAKNVAPERVAALAWRALTAKRPKYVYNLNRNPLLRLLSLLPDRLQVAIIHKILQ